MFERLPLTALRAFESAARLRSFKLAAAEVLPQIQDLDRLEPLQPPDPLTVA